VTSLIDFLPDGSVQPHIETESWKIVCLTQ